MANDNQTGIGRGGSGNFANDPDKAREAGKKGGEHSHGGSQQQNASHSGKSQQGNASSDTGSSQRGGTGNFANDREKASEAGKKGGEHSRSSK